MARNVKLDEEFLDGIDAGAEPATEEIPDIPKVRTSSGRKTKAPKAVREREFDIRAAHQAWKEKYGIEDDFLWR